MDIPFELTMSRIDEILNYPCEKGKKIDALMHQFGCENGVVTEAFVALAYITMREKEIMHEKQEACDV